MEIDAFKGYWAEAFPNVFPRLATSRERAEVSVSVCSQRGRGGQQLGSKDVRCLA